MIKSNEPIFNNLKLEERLLTKDDLANYLQCSVSYIDKLVINNEIPFLKIGRLVRFKRDAIAKWL